MPTKEPTVTIQKLAEPVHLTITRNAKGKVQYEISIHTASVDDVAEQTKQLEAWVQAKFKGQLAEATP